MFRTHSRSALRVFLLLGLALSLMALVACGDDDDNGGDATATKPADGGPTADTSVSGTITIEGSSTVQPFTLELIDAFDAAFPDTKVNPPSGLGSGAGITAFINKEVDIAQASRQMKADEIEQAKAAGLDPFETTILRDALAIVVHPDNTAVAALTEEQVAKIFAGQITDWSEVGGDAGKINVYTRNEESGTFAYMEEDVIQKVLGKEAAYGADINKQANAPAGLSAVARDPQGIFYAGLGNLAEVPADSVRVVPISKDASSAAVEPSAATVASGEYPIARGLFYYTNGDPSASDNAALKAFVEFALGDTGQTIGEGLGFLRVN